MEGFEIYPNPATDNIQVSFKGSNAYLTIYNLLGNKISEFEYLKNQNIDVRSLNSGIYFIEVNSLQSVYRRKIVKL
ncbi:MAG: T9SS type A sorting domain-containing protein [Bacteroidia bacterium]